jgi:deoxyhypusine synthase
LEAGEENVEESGREKTNCKIFLGYTSNMISSGVRDSIRYLCQHNMVYYALRAHLELLLRIYSKVDCIVSSAGGIEEDFIKCLAPTYIGEFSLKGKDLRKKGINRIGNLLAPNDNYCKFEDWIMPIFNTMLKEQQETVGLIECSFIVSV